MTSTVKQPNLETLLSNLKKDELIRIIVDLADHEPGIEKGILFTYAPAEDEVKASKKLIREYINRYKRQNFISWNVVPNALQGADMTLGKARDKMAQGESETAAELCVAVMGPVVGMLQYADDSGGYIGDVMGESLMIIHEAVFLSAETKGEPEKDKLFSILLKEALHKRYDDWTDWRYGLLESSTILCDSAKRKDKLDQHLEQMITEVDKNEWGAKFEISSIKMLQLALIEQWNNEEEKMDFINENIRYDEFRKKAIDILLEKGEYSEVLALCEEGQQVDMAYRGLVAQWRKYMLLAYEGLGDTTKQKELMHEFIYAGEFSYYNPLKKLYTREEWPEVLNDLFETFENESHLSYTYLQILKEEQLNEKILGYTKRKYGSIMELYPELKKDYPEDVNELMISYIASEAEKSNDRKKYRKVCKHIKEYKKVFGSQFADGLIQELKQKYVKRPAFVDELGKIK
ncbi:hypothetical protein [Rossellomorea aquimaris]|uniref:Uncharacterized protein n=1 Tax=Rossellomorea aquimaris TaxID=189382 RepID=A0A366EMR4_9BACI|nr:hypothetical protein [Rossellomorea aquimaris]RBP03000.1 hypothetical protein DET59_11197 [Rossellomorea aquimaris]